MGVYKNENGTAVSYAESTNAANFASVENTSTASKAYAVGDFLMYKGQFYKVTAAIAKGATLTVGTNIVADSCGSEFKALNASITQMNSDILWYGTCPTAAATQAKVATTTDRKLGNLTAGQKVAIKMTNNNTHATPTLNVDGKGAKSIKAFGTTAPTVWWKAGDVVTFVYDGTNWIMGVSAGEIEQINASLTKKINQKSGSISSGTYTGINIDWMSYDETQKKILLHKKGAGADSVIPFSGGDLATDIENSTNFYTDVTLTTDVPGSIYSSPIYAGDVFVGYFITAAYIPNFNSFTLNGFEELVRISIKSKAYVCLQATQDNPTVTFSTGATNNTIDGIVFRPN